MSSLSSVEKSYRDACELLNLFIVPFIQSAQGNTRPTHIKTQWGFLHSTLPCVKVLLRPWGSGREEQQGGGDQELSCGSASRLKRGLADTGKNVLPFGHNAIHTLPSSVCLFLYETSIVCRAQREGTPSVRSASNWHTPCSVSQPWPLQNSTIFSIKRKPSF